MMPTTELNNRSNLILQSFADLNSLRIVLIALPFLAFNPTTALVSAIGIGCYQGYTLWNTTADKTTTGNKWTDAALLVSSTALSYFCPLAQLVLSNGVSLAASGYKLWTAENWQNRGMLLLQISHQSVHLTSMYYGTAGWMGVSLLSQATSELFQAWKAFKETKKNQTPEMIAFIILAALRVRKAASYLPEDFLWPKAQKLTISQPTLQKLTEEQKGKEEKSIQLEEESSSQPPATQQAVEETPPATTVSEPAPESAPVEIPSSQPPETQQMVEETPLATTVSEPAPQPLRKATAEDLANLIKKQDKNFDLRAGQSFIIDKRSLLDFRAVLLKEGFLPEIEGIEFDSRIYNCFFEGLSFKNCKFRDVGFNNCKFDDVSFIKCSFKDTTWSNVTLQNSIFNTCNFRNAQINCDLRHEDAYLISCYTNLVFTDCDFSKSSFGKPFNRFHFGREPEPPVQFNTVEFSNCNFYKSLWDNVRAIA
jgi:uncharacterized protein YjbI with pentapeptide repeats